MKRDNKIIGECHCSFWKCPPSPQAMVPSPSVSLQEGGTSPEGSKSNPQGTHSLIYSCSQLSSLTPTSPVPGVLKEAKSAAENLLFLHLIIPWKTHVEQSRVKSAAIISVRSGAWVIKRQGHRHSQSVFRTVKYINFITICQPPCVVQTGQSKNKSSVVLRKLHNEVRGSTETCALHIQIYVTITLNLKQVHRKHQYLQGGMILYRGFLVILTQMYETQNLFLKKFCRISTNKQKCSVLSRKNFEGRKQIQGDSDTCRL